VPIWPTRREAASMSASLSGVMLSIGVTRPVGLTRLRGRLRGLGDYASVASFWVCSCSYLMGDLYPIAECKRTGL